MGQHTVRRDGDRDLEFIGQALGYGEMETSTGRGTVVQVYRTKGGRYVVSVRQWTQWQGEHDSYRAAVCGRAADVLAWLIEDAGGQLGRASKEALEAAAVEDEALAAVLTEWIE